MEGQEHRKTQIPFGDWNITIPPAHCGMKLKTPCSFERISQRQISGTMEFDWYHNFCKAISIYLFREKYAPPFNHILAHPNEAMFRSTEYHVIIDFIPYSSLYPMNNKCNQTLTNTSGLLTSTLFSTPFDYFALRCEIVLVECLKRNTLISLSWWLSFIFTIWW